MTYPFPPQSQTLLAVIVASLLAQGLMLVLTLRLFSRRHRANRLFRFALWLAVTVWATGPLNSWLAGDVGSDIIRFSLVQSWVIVVAISIVAWLVPSRRHLDLAVTGLCMSILLSCCFWANHHSVEGSRRPQCRNHLKQHGLALHNWHDAHRKLPDAVHNVNGGPPVSWRVELIPFQEWSERLQRMIQYDRSASWDSEKNQTASEIVVPVFGCPSHEQLYNDAGQSLATYVMMTGPGTLFPEGKGLPIKAITDGTSSTIALGEGCGLNIVWTEPRDADTSVNAIGVNLPGATRGESPGILSSYHCGGVHVLLADGSVQFLSSEIDKEVLRALLSPSGGEEHPVLP